MKFSILYSSVHIYIRITRAPISTTTLTSTKVDNDKKSDKGSSFPAWYRSKKFTAAYIPVIWRRLRGCTTKSQRCPSRENSCGYTEKKVYGFVLAEFKVMRKIVIFFKTFDRCDNCDSSIGGFSLYPLSIVTFIRFLIGFWSFSSCHISSRGFSFSPLLISIANYYHMT